MTESNSEFDTPITFKGYRIRKIEYYLKESEEEIKKSGLKCEAALSEDKTSGRVDIEIEFNSDKTSENKINGCLAIEGYFELSDKLNDDEKKMYIQQNGAAMLYPYARTIVSMITSFDDNKVGILPTVNFVNLANKEE